MSLNPGDIISVANERLRVEAVAPRVKLRSLSSPGVTRYPTLAFVEERGVVVERAPVVEEPEFYTFTRQELAELLDDHAQMFLAHRDTHGKEHRTALLCAQMETIARLDAEREVPSRG